jgi:hypothetical protein
VENIMGDILTKTYSMISIAVMILTFYPLFHWFLHKTRLGRRMAISLKRFLTKKTVKSDPGVWGTNIRINFKNLDQEINLGSKSIWRKLKLSPAHVHEIKLFLLISGIAIGSRLMLYFVAYLGAVIIAQVEGSFFKTFEGIWNQWDSGMYIFIAKNWYVTVTDKKLLIVFFPFYPILMKLFNVVLKNYFMSGIVISNLALCFSTYYFYKLVRFDFNKYVSFNAVKYLLIFPFSFFLGACFSDGLFLALSIITFYYIRKQKWLLVGIFGFFATLTRNFGILLLIPAVIEYLSSRSNYNPVNLWRMIRHGIFILFIPFGYGVYLLINKLVTGSWTTFMKYQAEYWSHTLAFFPEIGMNIEYAIGPDWSFEDKLAIWIPQALLAILVAFLIYYAIKKIRYSYIIYMFVYLALCLSTTWLISGARYSLGIFPMYLTLALLSRNRYVNLGISFVTYMLLGFYTVAYAIGYRIM